MIKQLLNYLNSIPTWTSIQNNPVILKEMRSRMRGWRSLAALTGFIVLISFVVGMIYFSFTQTNTFTIGATARKNLGQTIFYSIYFIQLLIISLTAPALTAGGISGEREHQTFDLLRTTLLSARSLVVGKLLAAVSFVLLLLIVSVPIQSIGLAFGGVSPAEVIIGTIILVLTALNFGAIGLFFSSFISKTRISTVLAQLTTTIFSIALPILTIVGIAVLDAIAVVNSHRIPEFILYIVGWFVSILSPFATSILSEIILIEEQTLLLFQINTSGVQFWLPSPWLGFMILYPMLTLGFLTVTINVVRRPGN